MGRRVGLVAVLVATALLAGCKGGKVECRDGTSHQRGGKGSVVCAERGGEKWNGSW